MPVLKFKTKDVERVLDHALRDTKHTLTSYGTPAFDGPGLFLVGDEGVYLMSNGQDRAVPGEHVAYAEGCNPHVEDFDIWWENKRELFGGDDGSEAALTSGAKAFRVKIAGARRVELRLTPSTLEWVVVK